MPVDPKAAEVRAAGGVVYRRTGAGGGEVALVYRPRYHDWSLPKGKLDEGEKWKRAALREVEEEVGAEVELGPELEPIGYRDNKGREKVVRYWLMEALRVGDQTADPEEVDEVRWCSAREAFELMTYERDKNVLAEGLEVLGE